MKTKSSHERRVAKYKWERDRALADLAKERERADDWHRVADDRTREILRLRAALDASRAREERLRAGARGCITAADEAVDEPDDFDLPEVLGHIAVTLRYALAETVPTSGAELAAKYGFEPVPRVKQSWQQDGAEPAAVEGGEDANSWMWKRPLTEPDDVEGGEPDWVATAGSGLSESGDEPDDAEQAARELLEWWGRQRAGIVIGPVADERLVTSVAALVRARDAQAREAGRVEGWEQAQKASALVAHNAWGRAPTGPVTRALERVHDAICELKRPDRAKGERSELPKGGA